MIVAKSSVRDCSQTDYPATRGLAFGIVWTVESEAEAASK